MKRRAVLPRFIEIRAARENLAALTDFSSDHQIGSAVCGPRSRVDWSAVGLRNEHVTIGVKDFASECRFPFSLLPAGPQGKVRSILIAVGGFERYSGGLRGARDKLHHAAERVTAVEAGSALLRDLDGGDRFAGNAVPIHPSAEGVVERNSILEDEGAAGAVGAQTSERNSLGGGVRHATVRSSIQAETRNLAQLVVEGQGGRVLQVFARQFDVAHRDVGEEGGCPVGGYLHLLIHRGRRKGDF